MLPMATPPETPIADTWKIVVFAVDVLSASALIRIVPAPMMSPSELTVVEPF